MQKTSTLVQYFQICRCLSSSSVNWNSIREGRFMNKLMRTKKTKKVWYDNSMDLRNTMKFINPVSKSISPSTLRRVSMRNKLFMEHITDQLSMGQVAELIGKHMEVTHVEVTPNFQIIKVYWIHTDDESPSEEVLERCAQIIRQELVHLHVIGIVPPIKFVKNKQFIMHKEVEEKLRTIAPDLEAPESPLYSEEIQSAISYLDEIMNKKQSADDSSTGDCSETDETKADESDVILPVMKHDVLGLDRYKIMCRITTSISKTKAAIERRMLNIDISADMDTDNDPSNRVSDKVTNFLTKQEQQQLFADFLTKRRIEEKRRYRMKLSQEQQLNHVVESDDNDNENYDTDVYVEHNDESEDEIK